MKRSIPMLLTVTVLAGLFLAATTPGAGQTPPNLPRVLETQRALVAQEPANAAAWNDLGNLLALSRDAAGAEEAYQQAVELAPDSAAYHYNLALLLQENDRFKDAAEHYRRVLELDPTNAWAHYQLGVVNEERGHDARAIELYGQAFRLDPMLAFPDVNPHVIESDLMTEAMLRGYRQGLVEPHAPRVYQEPDRITYMMVAPPPAAGAPAAQAPQAPPGTPDVPPTLPPGERRVLDQGDLGKGTASQAAPQPRGGYQPPGGGNAGRAPSTVRSWRPPSPPEGRQQEDDGRSGTRGGVVGGAVGVPQFERPSGSVDDPPPTTRTVVPGGRTPRGVGSTGRLEMILVPSSQDPDDRRG